MKILGIESSCDETAAAVYTTERALCSQVVFSQIAEHRRFGGVVPELASRSHSEQIVPVVQEALHSAGYGLEDLDAIAVTCCPGLLGSLLVGVCFAKGLAYAAGIPLLGVNHLEGHIASVYLEHQLPFPQLCLIASGGHTALYLVTDYGCYASLSQTADDAVGEAFDKIARMLGFEYPGGATIERLAALGQFKDYRRYPRLRQRGLSLSFSGIKTAVLYDLIEHGYYDREKKQLLTDDLQLKIEVASSLLVAIGDILLDRIQSAIALHAVRALTFVGGVAANRYLTRCFAASAEQHGLLFAAPSPAYCTDNGAMIAYVGHYRAQRGQFDDLMLDICPRVRDALSNQNNVGS